MSADFQREFNASPQPEIDESYWRALLQEAEDTPEAHESADDDVIRFTSVIQQARSAADNSSDWATIRACTEKDETLQLYVSGYNRGGLLVEWNALRGFVPASQLIDFPATANPTVRQKSLAARVGQMLSLRVIELNQEHNRLILSERAAKVRPGERAGLLTRIQTGEQVQGVVTNLCEFGAFIDLGGIEGLIHISELSWGRVGHPNEVLRRGQIVDVKVLEVKPDAGRVALSMKRLHPDPWATVNERYRIGEYVTGIVTNVVDFGAFARIEEGLEGLIHVSELAEGHFLHPRNVLSEGQEVRARILSIDGRARRLGLTLRSTPADA
ncbi:MAG: S1 RNA-binding domain-containing protein [Pleurocapsa minor GSE-CHR-MK-17-07R]|jgi:small subunit ribosomal protein S1|nr:S1 RNA-binding domain-containing protein [Pleurocapsa minor GSE-CHR-MK 17-07R]